jgi:methionine-rich copper-binding protein CopC
VPAPVRRSATPAALLLAAVLAVLSLAVAAPAAAHARFVGSDPAEGSTVAELPAAVVMSYNEEISPQFVDTAVIPPGGEPVVVEATVDGVAVRVPVGDDATLAAAASEAAAADVWQVVARVVSVDGHPVEHTTEFTLAEAAAPAQEPTTTDPDDVASPAPAATPEPSAQPDPDASGPTVDDAATTGPTTGAATAETLPADPVSNAAAGLPTWAGVLIALALVGAAGTALLLQWRRRSPGADPGTDDTAGG